MVTISVVFTKDKQPVPKGRQYTYNTESEVKEGDLVTADTVKGNLQVVTVHETLYSHFDYSGNLYEENVPEAKGEIKVIDCKLVEE